MFFKKYLLFIFLVLCEKTSAFQAYYTAETLFQHSLYVDGYVIKPRTQCKYYILPNNDNDNSWTVRIMDLSQTVFDLKGYKFTNNTLYINVLWVNSIIQCTLYSIGEADNLAHPQNQQQSISIQQPPAPQPTQRYDPPQLHQSKPQPATFQSMPPNACYPRPPLNYIPAEKVAPPSQLPLASTSSGQQQVAAPPPLAIYLAQTEEIQTLSKMLDKLRLELEQTQQQNAESTAMFSAQNKEAEDKLRLLEAEKSELIARQLKDAQDNDQLLEHLQHERSQYMTKVSQLSRQLEEYENSINRLNTHNSELKERHNKKIEHLRCEADSEQVKFKSKIAETNKARASEKNHQKNETRIIRLQLIKKTEEKKMMEDKKKEQTRKMKEKIDKIKNRSQNLNNQLDRLEQEKEERTKKTINNTARQKNIKETIDHLTVEGSDVSDNDSYTTANSGSEPSDSDHEINDSAEEDEYLDMDKLEHTLCAELKAITETQTDTLYIPEEASCFFEKHGFSIKLSDISIFDILDKQFAKKETCHLRKMAISFFEAIKCKNPSFGPDQTITHIARAWRNADLAQDMLTRLSPSLTPEEIEELAHGYELVHYTGLMQHISLQLRHTILVIGTEDSIGCNSIGCNSISEVNGKPVTFKFIGFLWCKGKREPIHHSTLQQHIRKITRAGSPGSYSILGYYKPAETDALPAYRWYLLQPKTPLPASKCRPISRPIKGKHKRTKHVSRR